MNKRVFIVHGWGGYPEEGWFPWLKKELEQKNFKVFALSMPDTDEPKIETWVPFLAKQVGEPTENDYFVGHSMGCQTIMRYLETIGGKKVGGVVLAAGFFHLQNLEDENEEKIAKPWLETKIDLEKVSKTEKNFVAIFSDNDPFVPLSDVEIFKDKLGAKIIIEHDKGHFDEESEIKELPIVLDSILEMSK